MIIFFKSKIPSLFSYTEVYRAALFNLSAETVPAAARPQRSLHGRNQLLQSHPDGHQLLTGENSLISSHLESRDVTYGHICDPYLEFVLCI